MSTKALLGVVVCLALAGCAGWPPPPGAGSFMAMKAKPAKKCHDDCGVTIVVDTTSSAIWNTLTISDAEVFIAVPKTRKPKITWTLSVPGPGYEGVFGFDPVKGIDFGEDRDEFDNCRAIGADKFSCDAKHRNTDLTVYKYTVNVVVLKGLHDRPKALDPWVVSE